MVHSPVTVESTFIRQGRQYAMGTFIEGHLSPEDYALLSKAWKPSWGEPLMFSGGETVITCEMVLALLDTNTNPGMPGLDGLRAALHTAIGKPGGKQKQHIAAADAADRIIEAARRNGV